MNVTIIGYHGTDRKSAKDILEENKFDKSENEDDWLGSGVYFYTKLDNVILLNIRRYINQYKKYPEYKDLSKERKIIISEIQCDEEEILDLNEIENLRKFLGLWKMFYDKVENNKYYKKLKIKDCYIINWLFDHTEYFEGCKVIKNIFQLDLKFNRKILDIFYNKTRIGYTLHQQYICVIDTGCISSIQLFNKNYQEEYEYIKDLTNNILMIGDEDEI